ncbi:5055_t:CDS:2, partial [Dentiscutata heterogama]
GSIKGIFTVFKYLYINKTSSGTVHIIMEYLEFANDITPLKITGVVVNSDGTSRQFDLVDSDISKVLLMSLDEVREYIYQKGLALIGRQSTNFLNAFENKIPLAREFVCELKDILIPTNEDAQDGSYSFYLEKDLRMPSFPEIVERLHIDKGCKKDEDDNIVSVNESAFRIRKPHMMDEDLEPTDEYIDAVRNALNHSEDNQKQQEALTRVGKKFGFFWSKEVKLGGKLYVNGQDNDLNGLESENWQIIERNELLSLYNLLPQELILKIKKTNSETSTFRGVKIFTSVIVMNAAKPYRNVFGIRVDYLDDDNPYIV